jgi:DNA modification methylase
MSVINQEFGKNWTMYQGDSCEVLREIPTNTVHYSLFSPPFCSLFTYSDSERDLGNCKTDEEFYTHFRFISDELFRVLMPGRLLSCHCMNILATITKDGYIGMKDFRGDLIRIFQDSGFIFHSEVVIWKDPLVQATRTKVLSLAHKQIVTDSARCGQGTPDYIITMRKPGKNPEPVAHPNGFTRYIGEMEEPAGKKKTDQRTNKYSHEVWQRYASPVWMDINQTDTLNVRMARDQNDERHICPLQLGVIARCVELWTNPGDIVLSPFAGIGSEGYQSILQERKFIGIELKESYYNQAVKYLKTAEKRPKQLVFE